MRIVVSIAKYHGDDAVQYLEEGKINKISLVERIQRLSSLT
jgi:hypothetical protein